MGNPFIEKAKKQNDNPFIEKAVQSRARTIMAGNVKALSDLLERINPTTEKELHDRISARLRDARQEAACV